MNTPNKITMARIILIPVFIVFMLALNIPFNYMWALIVFVVASITDAVDGKIARKRGLVTDFGKFLDPLADKMLVMSALICFIQVGMAGAVMVIIILGREFLVTSLRTIAMAQGKVVAANIWGKLKTVSQMVAIIYTLLVLSYTQLQNTECVARIDTEILLWISAILTLISGVIYLWQNRNVLKTSD